MVRRERYLFDPDRLFIHRLVLHYPITSATVDTFDYLDRQNQTLLPAYY
jgi:hypothetical protein